MPRKASADRTLFALIALLALAGIVMVGSASSYVTLDRGGLGGSYHFLLRQVLFTALGLMVLHRFMRIDYHFFASRRVALGLLALSVLLLVAVFLFEARKGVHRWIPLGLMTFQPSELAKLALVVYLAWRIETKGEEINHPLTGTLPSMAVAGFLAGLVLIEPDMGTAVLLLLVAAVVLFAAGMQLRWVAGIATAGAFLLPLLILSAPYRARRLFSFLHPESDLRGTNFQLFQSKIALGSGGLTGSGLALGRQKMLFLPESHTDFIFSVIGEELGLIGTSLLVIVFALLLWRGLRVALRAPDRFGSALALGIVMFLVCQGLLNMGVATGILPTKGLPIPFVSYGGSSLLVSFAMGGILLNVSQQAR